MITCTINQLGHINPVIFIKTNIIYSQSKYMLTLTIISLFVVAASDIAAAKIMIKKRTKL